MNEPVQPNGEPIQQIIIALDSKGALHVNHPPNKIVALGMLAAAQAVIINSAVQAAPTIIPVSNFTPPTRQ